MHDLHKIPRKSWPVLVEMLADVIGEEAALNLFIRFNGRQLHVPTKIHADHLIVKTIGLEKAELLRNRFAGENFLFPKGAYLLRKIRNQNILRDWHAGMTQQDIASKYDLSTRQVSTIINHTPLDTTHV